VVPAHLVRLFTLPVIEKPRAAGFGYKREFLKEVIDHFVVAKWSIAVFWKLSLGKGTGTRTKEFSMPARMVTRWGHHTGLAGSSIARGLGDSCVHRHWSRFGLE
jgi:hypothetical protein